MVPDEALRYLLARGRAVKSGAMFVAEVYAQYQRYFADGFDAVYHKDPWDSLKWISMAGAEADTEPRQVELDRALAQYPQYAGDGPATWADFTPAERGRLVHFLENHDEARVASRYLGPTSWTNSGWGGGLDAHKEMAPLLLLASDGPILSFAGTELGERADGAEGFGGDDGKTTMFDYWSFPLVSLWSHGHAYDGTASLPPESADLRAWYRALYGLSQDAVFVGDVYAGLEGFNNAENAAHYPRELFAYARCATGGAALGVVVANFLPDATQTSAGTVRIPANLATSCGLAAGTTYGVSIALDETSGASAGPRPDGTIATETLTSAGLPVQVRGRATRVYVVR
jgi:hypothetical protein